MPVTELTEAKIGWNRARRAQARGSRCVSSVVTADAAARSRLWPRRPEGALRGLAVLGIMVGFGLVLAQGAPVDGGAVRIRVDPIFGAVLTTASGSTLYTYALDHDGAATCVGACLAQFQPFAPPLDTVWAAAIEGAWTSTSGEGGARQLVYDGRPLYLSRSDRQPGDTFGHQDDGPWQVANAGPTVRVFEHPVLGEILVGPTGMTLYTFANDEPDDLVCDDGCSENWPPLVVSRRPIVPPGLDDRVDIVPRAPDEHRPARIQVTYRGRPLYYWSRDAVPGDVTGEGMAGLWSVARP